MAWAMQHCNGETETKLFLKDRRRTRFISASSAVTAISSMSPTMIRCKT